LLSRDLLIYDVRSESGKAESGNSARTRMRQEEEQEVEEDGIFGWGGNSSGVEEGWGIGFDELQDEGIEESMWMENAPLVATESEKEIGGAQVMRMSSFHEWTLSDRANNWSPSHSPETGFDWAITTTVAASSPGSTRSMMAGTMLCKKEMQYGKNGMMASSSSPSAGDAATSCGASAGEQFLAFEQERSNPFRTVTVHDHNPRHYTHNSSLQTPANFIATLRGWLNCAICMSAMLTIAFIILLHNLGSPGLGPIYLVRTTEVLPMLSGSQGGYGGSEPLDPQSMPNDMNRTDLDDDDDGHGDEATADEVQVDDDAEAMKKHQSAENVKEGEEGKEKEKTGKGKKEDEEGEEGNDRVEEEMNTDGQHEHQQAQPMVTAQGTSDTTVTPAVATAKTPVPATGPSAPVMIVESSVAGKPHRLLWQQTKDDGTHDNIYHPTVLLLPTSRGAEGESRTFLGIGHVPPQDIDIKTGMFVREPTSYSDSSSQSSGRRGAADDESDSEETNDNDQVSGTKLKCTVRLSSLLGCLMEEKVYEASGAHHLRCVSELEELFTPLPTRWEQLMKKGCTPNVRSEGPDGLLVEGTGGEADGEYAEDPDDELEDQQPISYEAGPDDPRAFWTSDGLPVLTYVHSLSVQGRVVERSVWIADLRVVHPSLASVLPPALRVKPAGVGMGRREVWSGNETELENQGGWVPIVLPRTIFYAGVGNGTRNNLSEGHLPATPAKNKNLSSGNISSKFSEVEMEPLLLPLPEGASLYFITNLERHRAIPVDDTDGNSDKAQLGEEEEVNVSPYPPEPESGLEIPPGSSQGRKVSAPPARSYVSAFPPAAPSLPTGIQSSSEAEGKMPLSWNETTGMGACFREMMPQAVSELGGRIRGATNALKLTLCNRGECQANSSNTVFFAIAHIVQSRPREWVWRFVTVWDINPPFRPVSASPSFMYAGLPLDEALVLDQSMTFATTPAVSPSSEHKEEPDSREAVSIVDDPGHGYLSDDLLVNVGLGRGRQSKMISLKVRSLFQCHQLCPSSIVASRTGSESSKSNTSNSVTSQSEFIATTLELMCAKRPASGRSTKLSLFGVSG
ncbi:hypothetical protein CBR_g68841, partial [Chara braunii]